MGMFSPDDGDWAPLNLTEEAQEAFNGVMFNIEQMKKVMEENNMTCLEKCNEACRKYWNREFPEEKKLNDLIDEVCSLNPAISPEGLKEAVVAMPKILDSGNRREFETGAVRDIQEGKGRCDLLPLDVVADVFDHAGCIREFSILTHIDVFIQTAEPKYLYKVLDEAAFIFEESGVYATMFLEVAKHFEEGCKKYGENNWQKGIPTHCYIDSAVRHYLKYLRGDTDEPHDRAFVWNILCCIWTCIHKPELNDYAKKEE